MNRRSLVAVLVALPAIAVLTCSTPTNTPTTAPQQQYVPKAQFCPDPSRPDSLCYVMPAMIGPDPPLGAPHGAPGYHGLSNNVPAANLDVQTPFDNMSWQMFVALNQKQRGPFAPRYVWQDYPRVEDVYGPSPPARCPNSFNLPVISLTAKGGGQPTGRNEEFIEAATDKPLIDRNGNWTLYERRVNNVEVRYLTNYGLTTKAGQQKFVQDRQTVNFTPSGNTPTGTPGAVELKLAWRILRRDLGDDPGKYITLNALLSVDASEVRGGSAPICESVQLGLVGFHIIQKNPTVGSLLPQWIWATFEHVDNVPLSPNACDPATQTDCFTKAIPTVCTAPTSASGRYSYFNASCTNCPVNQPRCSVNQPAPCPTSQPPYLWSPKQPYAQDYLNEVAGRKYGTQVVRCWQIYSLTQLLNTQWRTRLAQANSVLQNYMLIGTQWGANLEPNSAPVDNGAVPPFLSNTTLETYIQTKSYGSCIVCHKSATLADRVTDANFSFLLGLAR